jgi:hypothetical protein
MFLQIGSGKLEVNRWEFKGGTFQGAILERKFHI